MSINLSDTQMAALTKVVEEATNTLERTRAELEAAQSDAELWFRKVQTLKDLMAGILELHRPAYRRGQSVRYCQGCDRAVDENGCDTYRIATSLD